MAMLVDWDADTVTAPRALPWLALSATASTVLLPPA
jgi:hypothetical protein